MGDSCKLNKESHVSEVGGMFREVWDLEHGRLTFLIDHCDSD